MPDACTDRRGFLLGAAGLVAAGCGAGRTGAAGRRRPRVVVVGAGIAGLAAATAARAEGWEPVVLEADDRVGGRIHTLRGFRGGQVAEGGGEFLDSSHTVMRGYARRLGLPLDDLYAAGPDLPGCAYYGGRRRAETEEHDALVERFYAAAWRAGGDGSAAAVLAGITLTGAQREWLRHAAIRDEYTVEAEDLSVGFLNSGADSTEPERWRVRGGNDRIPRALADALGGRVHLRAPVSAIARDASGVTVTAGGERVRGATCVLAAPLPAVRAIRFTPALPAPLAAAVAQIGYGTGAKVALQYARRPWREQGFNGDTYTDLPISTAWEATDAQRGVPRILLAFTVGGPGAASVALSDEARIAAAAADVARVYPGAGAPIDARTLAWPHTYTAYAPGQWRHHAALRRPAGRLILAGEHVGAGLTGYMEGAARSGLRAARMLDRL